MNVNNRNGCHINGVCLIKNKKVVVLEHCILVQT